MSDEINKFAELFAKEAENDKKQKELKIKKTELDSKLIDHKLEVMRQNEEELKLAQSADFNQMTAEHIATIKRESEEYIEDARKGMKFISDDFLGVVPFFRKNLILIGGKTGEGKSTTVSNIIRSVISQTNPLTNRRRRALVITNEEKAEDVYNRVTCLAKNWYYTNHDKFTDEQKNTFSQYIDLLSKDGWVTVIDNTFNNSHGVTTTLEGIQSIFDNLIKNEVYYDVVIIDYYQNIKSSKKNPYLDEYKVQAMLANALDKYKNVYPAPIVVMAQANPPDEERKVPFEFRIKGRKIITDPATFTMEMIADRPNLRTEWVVHKSRFTEAVGKSFFTGFDKGKYVKYDLDFQRKVCQIKEQRQWQETVGKHVFEKKEEKK